MVAVKPIREARTPLVQSIYFFEKRDHAIRIVAGLVSVLYAEVIRLGLKVTAKLAEDRRDTEVRGLVDANPRQAPGHDHYRNHRQLGHGTARGAARRVACGHVSDFMR